MKLYRGMNCDYKQIYNNRVNLSYYECWTDNVDLAKIYGDKIYCVEVETENKVINAHGDRVLCFLNRQIETQGIKGKEFLLYTEHESYQTLKIEKIN